MKYSLSKPENWHEAVMYFLQDFIESYNKLPRFIVLGEDTLERLRQECEHQMFPSNKDFKIEVLSEFYGMKIRVGNFGAKGREKRFIGFMLE